MVDTYRILTLNNISARGLERLPAARFTVAADLAQPDGILVRSADMHKSEIPASVLAIGRAGAGTNNIPVAELSKRGIPVFNAPGANANAVKELVLAGMFLAARNICQAWSFARSLSGDDHAIDEAVEKGKKKFVGVESDQRPVPHTLTKQGLRVSRVDHQTFDHDMRHLVRDFKATHKHADQGNF